MMILTKQSLQTSTQMTEIETRIPSPTMMTIVLIHPVHPRKIAMAALTVTETAGQIGAMPSLTKVASGPTKIKMDLETIQTV